MTPTAKKETVLKRIDELVETCKSDPGNPAKVNESCHGAITVIAAVLGPGTTHQTQLPLTTHREWQHP